MRKRSFIFPFLCLIFLALLVVLPFAALAQSTSNSGTTLQSDNYLGHSTTSHNDDDDDNNNQGPGNGFILPAPTGLTITGDFTTAPLALTFSWKHTSSVQPRSRWFQVAIVYSDFRFAADKWVMANRICTDTECNVAFEDLFGADLLNGDYKWYVRAWARNTFSDWSEPGEFTINLLEPEVPDGFTVTINQGRPSIIVPNQFRASWYQVYVGHNDEDDKSLAHIQWYKKNRRICIKTSCELILDFHPTNGKYVAYILVWGPGGFSRGGKLNGWAGPIEFEINFDAPPDVVPMTPTIGGGHGPHFGWQGAVWATWYHIWIGTDDFTETIHFDWHPALDLNCNNAGVCQLEFEAGAQFEEGKSYVWYIRSWGPGGFGRGGQDGWIKGIRFRVQNGNFIPQPDSNTDG